MENTQDQYISSMDIDKRITWRELADFVLSLKNEELDEQIVAFDTYTDEEIPVLGISGKFLVVNA